MLTSTDIVRIYYQRRVDGRHAFLGVYVQNYCRNRKEEMTDHWKYRTDSMEKLKQKRPELEAIVRDPERQKELYRYTFNYAKNKDQKCMDVEVRLLS